MNVADCVNEDAQAEGFEAAKDIGELGHGWFDDRLRGGGRLVGSEMERNKGDRESKRRNCERQDWEDSSLGKTQTRHQIGVITIDHTLDD